MAKIGVSLVSLPSKPSLALAMHIGKHSHGEEAGGINNLQHHEKKPIAGFQCHAIQNKNENDSMD